MNSSIRPDVIRRALRLQTLQIGRSTVFTRNKTVSASLRQRPVENKNVIVTGAARGIGKSIALRLALDGYNVCVNDIAASSKACDEVVKEIQSLGRRACTAVADVSSRKEVAEMIRKSTDELGPLHVMCARPTSSPPPPSV